MARILIAEHNESTASYLSAALKKAGNSVIMAHNFLDAWKFSSKEQFDVLLVNVVMPGVDGFVLAQKVLQDNPGLQVIFITGFACVAMDTYATPVYAPAPITTQPFHLSEIASRVRYLMGLGGLPQKTSYTADSSVIYAEFGAAKTSMQQQASS